MTYPGYEWSGNTPLGGDRNVFFAREGGKIIRSSCELLPEGASVYPDSPTAAELFKNLEGPDPFVLAQVGGRYADLRMHDPELEIAVEIHSCWGTFEWLLADAFNMGYRLGICANSDEHKCRPGASYPGAGEFGAYGGLTCVLSERLDRESVYKALKARHFYATTGNRALLRVSLDTTNKSTAIMGDVVRTDADNVTLNLSWAGTGPLDYIEIRNGVFHHTGNGMDYA